MCQFVDVINPCLNMQKTPTWMYSTFTYMYASDLSGTSADIYASLLY